MAMITVFTIGDYVYYEDGDKHGVCLFTHDQEEVIQFLMAANMIGEYHWIRTDEMDVETYVHQNQDNLTPECCRALAKQHGFKWEK